MEQPPFEIIKRTPTPNQPYETAFTNIDGIWRQISNPQTIPGWSNIPATDEAEFNRIFRGTSGSDYGDYQATLKAFLGNQAFRNQPPPPPTTPPPPSTPNAFRPRAEGENMTSYLQAKQAHEMQTTGSSTISFGTPQVAQPAQPAPIAPQAPVSPVSPAPATQQPQTPQTPATGQKQYVKYAGSPDVFDRSGRYISAQEAAGIPNLFQQVEEIATPRPDVKVESDFAKLAGQNISQMIKDATQSVQPAQPIQPAQPAQPTQPAQPATGEVTTAQKPYVQYEGSPDVFERSTGTYIPAEQAEKIPDFFSKVEQAKTIRPGVTTEADFAKLAQTNLKLQQSGATTTPQDFQDNPLKAFQDTYSQIWNSLGLGSVKEQIEITLKAMKEVDFEMIDKIAEVNDNPWISEAERSRQVTKLQGKYEQKNKANTENLKLLQGLFETGQKEAQFVSSNALDVYYKERTFDENEKLKAMDLAEKMATAMDKKSFQDLVGSDGRMHTYIVNEAGEKLVDLGVSELPKATGRDTKTITLGGKTVLIDSTTGEVIKEYTTEPTPAEKKDIEEKVKNARASLQIANDKLEDINSLMKHKGLSLTVGASKLSRGLLAGTPFDLFTGDREEFAGKIHRLVSGLSLDSLLEAKARGATFGALSDNELSMLANAASAIDDWEIKKDGKGTGMWDVSEKSFKEELNRIKTLTEKAVRDSEKVIVPEDEFDQYYNSAFDALNYFE